MATECCGKPCDTPYCPMCGAALKGLTLAAMRRTFIARAVSADATAADESMLRNSRTSAVSSAKMYRKYVAVIEDAMKRLGEPF